MTRSAQIAITASAAEAEAASRDALTGFRDALGPNALKPKRPMAEEAAAERLRLARLNLEGIDRQLADITYASVWHLIEVEREDAEWEVNAALKALNIIRDGQARLSKFK